MAMSTETTHHNRAASQLEPIDTTFTLKKRKKSRKKKKKKQKPYPINPVQSTTPTVCVSPSKSARKPSKPLRKKTKKKSINKASSLIRHSPRFSNNKTKLSFNAKSPIKKKNKKKKKKKKSRTNSSSVYNFVDYEAYVNENQSDSSETSESNSSVNNTNTPFAVVGNNTVVSLNNIPSNQSDESNISNLSNNSNKSLHKTKTKTKTPRKRSQSVTRHRQNIANKTNTTDNTNNEFDDIYDNEKSNQNITDNALLKRLKTENKQLRKSRNILRKDNGVLTKIEGKLRHKLDMILIKFKQIKMDFISDDNTDWNKLQKKGDIEGVLDAVFMRFNQIADQFIKHQKQTQKVNKLQNEWIQFTETHLTHNSKDKKRQYEFEDMFVILNRRFNEFQQENNKLSDLVQMYENKNKKQQTEIDELEEKMLIIREKNEKLKKEKSELEGYQQKYVDMEHKLNEETQQFEDEKKMYTQKLDENEHKLNEISQENVTLKSNVDKKTDELKLVAKYTRELEAKNKALENDMNTCKTEIETMRKENAILKEFKDKCSRMEDEISKLKSENQTLIKRKHELDGLKKEHLSVTQSLNEVQAEIDGLQDEFRIIYKRKKKIETENNTLHVQINELKGKILELENVNHELNEIVNKPKREYGTQTDFGYILENEHLKALQSENQCLMKELDFLIAERSKFKPCLSDTDYHKGDINSIVVSPVNYDIITGGKHDNSLRIWKPKSNNSKNNENEGSEILFVPKKKALIDGMVIHVSMSNDGILLGVGASLKNSVNGYVIIYNMKDNGNVLCNLRSRTLLRFGKVHCVKFMRYRNEGNNNNIINSHNRNKSNSYNKKKGYKMRSSFNSGKQLKKKKLLNNKEKNALNYLVFCGDTTGMILCWNLSSDYQSVPVCVINGHSDIVYDMSIIDNKWLFSVSHDQCLMYINIEGFQNKICLDSNCNSVDYVFSKKLFNDDSKYPIKSIQHNKHSNELIFGSRKCNIFKMNNDDMDEKNNESRKYFVSKYGLNTKDLDHICKLKIRANLMVVQRTGINYVKIFNLNTNKLIKTYQIDDGKNDHKKFKIYDCGISYDQKYAILCVGIFNKENLTNLHLNRSALKGFKIPKSAKK